MEKKSVKNICVCVFLLIQEISKNKEESSRVEENERQERRDPSRKRAGNDQVERLDHRDIFFLLFCEVCLKT